MEVKEFVGFSLKQLCCRDPVLHKAVCTVGYFPMQWLIQELRKGGGGNGSRKLENELARAMQKFVWPCPHFVRPRLFDHLLSRKACTQVVLYPSDHSQGEDPSPRGWAAAVYETSAWA